VLLMTSSSFIELPVFPLRKTVRLPTESLTLNLYEDRYLEMARYILRDEDRVTTKKKRQAMLFGAMYTSNKPQVVGEGGLGPIVPLLREGDVGVLFLVEHWKEGLVPTVGDEPRHRIRIVGTGVGRFRVRRIVNNGYDYNNNTDARPYIVVEATVIVPSSNWNEYSPICDANVITTIDDDTRRIIDDLITKLGVANLPEFDEDAMRSELSSFAEAARRISETSVQERLNFLEDR